MTLVKICGITRIEDAVAVAESGADAIGFVFWPGSRRHVSPRLARALGAVLPSDIRRVGVFVDQDLAEIQETIAIAALDIVQLHGTEPAALARQVDRPVWRAVLAGMDVEAFRGYPADAFLVDGASVGTFGGAGAKPQDAQIQAAQVLGPLVLAGGLTASTVGDAIGRYRPHAVDVSSGVEVRPGLKDPDAVRAFTAAVRSADSHRNRRATVPIKSANKPPLIDHLTA